MVYLFVAYVYDANAILVVPMPTREDAQMIKAFDVILATLQPRHLTPTLNVMDNECSTAVAKYITNNDINIQLVAPATTASMRQNAPLLPLRSTSSPASRP